MRTRALIPLLLAAAAMILAGCNAPTTVEVRVDDTGGGVVAVEMKLDQAAAAYLVDDRAQLRLEDLEQAGWTVTGPREEGEFTVIRISHRFESSAQAQQLLDQLVARPGTFANFQIIQERSLWELDTAVSGQVDLTDGIATWADPSVEGSGLGFDPAELARNMGIDLEDSLTVNLLVTVPGEQIEQPLSYGQVNAVEVRNQSLNSRPITYFGIALFLMAAAIGVGAVWKVYKPRHRRSILDAASGTSMPKVDDGGRHFR